MLTGYLPFDEDNHTVLVKRICSADFEIPSHVSKEAQDLLRQILKVHPLQRIKIAEIKRHPWFTGEDLNSVILLGPDYKEDHFHVEQHILNKLLSYKMDFKGYDFEEIKDAIICKKNYSFVIAYQLLLDEYKKDNFQQLEIKNQLFFGNIKEALAKNIREINEIYNTTIEQASTGPQNMWLYGLTYKCSVEKCMNAVLQTLTELGIGVQTKSKDYSIKCVLEDETHKEDSMLDENEEDCILDFTIQIYSVDKRCKYHMVDIKRGTVGSPLVFMDVSDKLKMVLDKKLKKMKN